MKEVLSISQFSENLISFDVFKIKNTQTLWLNPGSVSELSILSGRQYNEELFKEDFSYASTSHGLLSATDFLLDERKVFYAERYGGVGVGQNGGGARTGNIFQYQIKGIGANPLAGVSSNHWYTYGGLNISDAVCEIILGSVLNNVLPRRTVRNVGLIVTNPEGAYYYYKNPVPKKSWGALLVREQCLRPAHFFRAADFQIKPEFRNHLTKDSIRVRNVVKKLRSILGEDDKKFIEIVFEFLSASAEQFSFSKSFRITHGSPSSSNLSIDGKWVDLTNASFLDGGKNYGINNPFFGEHIVPTQIAYDLCYIYSKVNRIRIDYSVIKSYYNKIFTLNFERSALLVLGLGDMPQIETNAEKSKVINYLYNLIHRDDKIVTEWPERLCYSDPVANFIAGLYLYITDVSAATLKDSFPGSVPIPEEVGDSFRYLYSLVGLTKPRVLSGALRSLKWAYYSAFYYRGRIVNEVEDMLNFNSLGDISSFIRSSNEFHPWALNLQEKDEVVLYKTAAGTVYYDTLEGGYNIAGFSCTVDTKVKTFYEMIQAVKFINSTDFTICRFSVSEALSVMGKVITPIENGLRR